MEIRSISRRQLLASAVVAGAVTPVIGSAASGRSSKKSQFKICIFSKHLQWLDYKGMAETAAELGFDGVDLTVRRKGHVLPERVEDDLPRAVGAIKAADIEPLMMATDINDPDDPSTEKILKTAGALGVKYYRLGKYRYTDDESIADTLSNAKAKMRDLAAMNEHYSICGSYQNHAGRGYVGAPIWDLYWLIRDLDPKYMGCQFDVRHATVEGGQTWPLDLRLISGHVNTLAIKDFVWQKQGEKWQTVNCPLGKGQVDFDGFLKLLKKHSVAVPVSIHYEYDLGGANHGATELTIGKQKLLAAFRSDLGFLKARLRKNGLT
ncbi:MAG: sugar phosphate isomerase/epimerase family protein [Planctomycetota bacterium]|jgi:sugar phosphate isomerase/epimerase